MSWTLSDPIFRLWLSSAKCPCFKMGFDRQVLGRCRRDGEWAMGNLLQCENGTETDIASGDGRLCVALCQCLRGLIEPKRTINKTCIVPRLPIYKGNNCSSDTSHTTFSHTAAINNVNHGVPHNNASGPRSSLVDRPRCLPHPFPGSEAPQLCPIMEDSRHRRGIGERREEEAGLSCWRPTNVHGWIPKGEIGWVGAKGEEVLTHEQFKDGVFRITTSRSQHCGT